MDKVTIEVAFWELEKAIEESEHYKHLNYKEFMLMSDNLKGSIPFKNRITRNYVFVNDGKLEVPQVDEPFMRGEF